MTVEELKRDGEALDILETIHNDEEARLKSWITFRAGLKNEERAALQARIDEQEKRVDALARAMHALRERR